MTSRNYSSDEYAANNSRNDSRNKPFFVPTRIPLFPNHGRELRAKAIMRWHKGRTFKAVNKLTYKHVLITEDHNETSFIQWNPDAVPSTRDVKAMLDWYTLNNIHYFPQVKSVKLLGVGLTNVYFLVRFYTPHDIPDQLPTTLPAKVYLRFILPLRTPESDNFRPDMLTDWETSMEQEIAAMCLVNAHTSLAPRVYLFDSYAQNELQLEWLMMEAVEGFVLEKCIHESNCTCETGLHGLAPIGRAPVVNGRLLANIWGEINDALCTVSASLLGEGGIGVSRLKMRWDIADPDLHNKRIEVEADGAPFPSFEEYFDRYFEAAYSEMNSHDRHVRKMKLYSRLEAEGTPWRELFDCMRRRNGTGDAKDVLWLNNANLHTGNILLDGDGHVVAIMGWDDSVIFPREWLRPLVHLNRGLKFCTADLLFRPLMNATKQFDVTCDVIPKPRNGFGFDHGCPEYHKYSQTHFRCDAVRSGVPQTPKTPLTPVKEAFGKIFKKA